MTRLSWAEEALNHLSVGVVLLAKDGWILFANRTAEHLLHRAEGVAARGGKLVANQHVEGTQLVGVIARARGGGAQVMRLERGAERRPLHLLIVALPAEAESAPVAVAESAVMAMIIDPEATTAPSSQTLQALYALTKAEGCLARRLVMGDRLEDYARQADISMNTARTHLKAVFTKTETDRQADLIRVLAWTLLDGTEESSEPHQNR
jgi:DNA-binding CsgD family transcriptional regulator